MSDAPHWPPPSGPAKPPAQASAQAAEKAAERGRRRLLPPVELADPDAAPDRDLPPSRLSRAIGAVRRFWRPWMWLAFLAVLLVLALTVPAPARLVESGTVVDARTVVTGVTVAGIAPTDAGHTGTYLTPVGRQHLTFARAALAAIRGDESLADPLESTMLEVRDATETALLMGYGVAPARGDPVQLGLAAQVDGDRVPPQSLGVMLEIFDQVNSLDLAAGRTILALGLLQPDGSLACPEDAAASLAAVPPPGPDLIILGRECGIALPSGITAVIKEVPGFPDAIVSLQS